MTVEIESREVNLSSSLLSSSSIELWDILNAVQSQNIVLNMSKVENLGGQCLEMIIAAERSWKKSGLNFEIVNASDAFLRDVKFLGAMNILPFRAEKDEL